MDLSVNQKKEFIVLTAVDLIHKNGINNLSTKEIALKVGISESLIFKIYPKKSDLILAVLDFFCIYDNDLFITATKDKKDAYEALLFYINKFLQYYENYPEITSVYQLLNMKTGTPQIDDKTKEINQKRFLNLKELILNAQEAGKINRKIDADILTEILYSSLTGLCIQWHTMNFNFPLMERANAALSLLLKAMEESEK